MNRAFAPVFLFVLLFFRFAAAQVPSSIPSSAFEGRIAEIDSGGHWLSVYSPYGLLFLVLHPQGLVFKKGARTDLRAFRPGDVVVAVPGGIRERDTVLILALEDWETYRAKTGSLPISSVVQSIPASRPRVPPMQKTPAYKPAVPARTVSIGPEIKLQKSLKKAKFVQVDGKIIGLNPDSKTILLQCKSSTVDAAMLSTTKIYTYSKDKFTILDFNKLFVGEWVRIGGFQVTGGKLKTESVLVFPESPR